MFNVYRSFQSPIGLVRSGSVVGPEGSKLGVVVIIVKQNGLIIVMMALLHIVVVNELNAKNLHNNRRLLVVFQGSMLNI